MPKGVWLVQQGVWAMTLESMPLAAGYLKATALQEPRIARETDIRIHNFDGGVSLFEMANSLFRDGAPDVLAFSVLGWNYHAFGALAETFKQINPDGWVVFGGNHVSHQAERVFGTFPDVDVVVNGEGEFTFRELLLANLDGRSTDALHDIQGISFRADGGITTTEDRPRLENLDEIGSPVLTGSVPLLGDDGEFRYDVALLETNRGCPYKCSFCYWGGAVGQRVRAFSRERLRQEVEVFAQHKVHTIVLCDANFGMLPIDVEFIEDVIAIREKYGFPKSIETSWAKNKSKVFYKIVKMMKEAGLHSSFTLALQTLDDNTLDLMSRRNMKVNDWEELAEWLDREGMQCYAELIWGAPGETVESFIKGYDRLAAHVSRVAVYPMLILPNTTYHQDRKRFGLVTVRGDSDDFEYLVSHDTMSAADNQYMNQLIFFARLVAENPVFRTLWTPLRELGGVSQSQAIRSLMEWFEAAEDQASQPFRSGLEKAFTNPDVLGPVSEYTYGSRDARGALRRWWREAMLPLVPKESADLLNRVFEYDMLTLPVYTSPGREPSHEVVNESLPVEVIEGERFYVWHDAVLPCDAPTLAWSLKHGEPYDHVLGEWRTTMYYKVGAHHFVGSTNHEEIVYYSGRPARELFGRGQEGATA
ncbi:KedN5 family methylcobalamin-dependent radical SAM C-methyltransferase [Saccharothrix obliqua]|uniref:KedN5 family methylcobalamin-dependent radical SAM C-methyltransferase n=1 Tax=Saccharothrix obliqua TaxID=2861747 RepID=UPI001C5CD7B1|nr:KedN5 family methylcobalamin-dependent radical SAM C-methyltransferase [Saccharothrix obliqua]MBW4721837.1 KedN5 family methylcobalamin-dependent radical SAM C-methyltransferase [Saccharothrix obliqua]